MSKPLKIVNVVSNIRVVSGGPAYSVPSLALALAKKGVDSTLFTISDGKSKETDIATEPCKVVKVKGKFVKFLRQVVSVEFKSRLTAYCVENSIDILHSNGLWTITNHTVASVARMLDIPLVISPRGTLTPWALNQKSLKKRVALKLYQQRDFDTAALFNATSRMEVENLKEFGIKKIISLIPNGIDLPKKRTGNTKKTGKKNALFLSRIHPKKGLKFLIDAFDRLRPPDWICTIVGPDEIGYRVELEKEIKKRGLELFFAFKGAVAGEAKWNMMRNADLFVLPTHTENFGVVVAEALAVGVPVLTTKGTPWQELEDFNCGWWVDVSVDAITEGLQKAFVCSPDQLMQMGKNGRTLVEENYSWGKIATAMIDVYRWVHDNSREKPACLYD